MPHRRLWDGHLVLPFAALDEPPRRGGDPRQRGRHDRARLRGVLPARRAIDGVEIDGELSEIGRRYFDMNNPNLHLYHEDARPFLRRIDADYDVISVDAYRQPYIPFYLATRGVLRARAATGSPTAASLIVNVGPPGGPGRPREGAERDDGARSSRTSCATRSRTRTRCSWRARRRCRRSSLRARGAARCPRELRPLARGEAARGSRRALEGGDVYTDDKAPVEWLIDKSIVDYAAGDDD